MTPSRTPPVPPATYDVADLMRLTKLSERTVRRRYREGRLPGLVRVGGIRSVRFVKSVVDRWLLAGCPAV